MNNAQLIMEEEEPTNQEAAVALREKVERLTEIIEALNHIAGSSYWEVLRKHVFNVDLAKAKRRLAREKDTIEIFRLQGNIEWGDKLNLEALVTKYRDELTAIRKKL